MSIAVVFLVVTKTDKILKNYGNITQKILYIDSKMMPILP